MRGLATPWTYFLHLSLSSVILSDSSTESPVHDLMLSIQAVRGLPRLRAPGLVPCMISFSRQFPCSPWCDHSMLVSLRWQCLTVSFYSSFVENRLICFLCCPWNTQNLSQSFQMCTEKSFAICACTLNEVNRMLSCQRRKVHYLRRGGYVSVVVCLSVCLLATLRKNSRTDLCEIFRKSSQWTDAQMIKVWWRSRSSSG